MLVVIHVNESGSWDLSDWHACIAGESPKAAGQLASDGVFLRLMALPKGRNLLARALRLLHSPLSTGQAGPSENGGRRMGPMPSRGCSPAMRLAWALLRNVSYLFGGHTAALAAIKAPDGGKPASQEVRHFICFWSPRSLDAQFVNLCLSLCQQQPCKPFAQQGIVLAAYIKHHRDGCRPDQKAVRSVSSQRRCGHSIMPSLEAEQAVHQPVLTNAICLCSSSHPAMSSTNLPLQPPSPCSFITKRCGFVISRALLSCSIDG